MAKKTQPLHSIPCTQASNIENIHNRMDKIEKTLNGNGDNAPGMKTDIALIKQSTTSINDDLVHIKDKLSTRAEIDFELEVERRVSSELSKKLKEIADAQVIIKKRGRDKITFAKDIILAVFIIINMILGYFIIF